VLGLHCAIGAAEQPDLREAGTVAPRAARRADRRISRAGRDQLWWHCVADAREQERPDRRLGASGRLVAAVHASAPISQLSAAYLTAGSFRLGCLTEPRCTGP